MALATTASTAPGDLQVPRPLRLLLAAGWSMAESIGLPAAAYLAAAGLGGRDAGLPGEDRELAAGVQQVDHFQQGYP